MKTIKISLLTVYISKVIKSQLDSWNNFFQGFLILFLRVLTLEKSQICCSVGGTQPPHITLGAMADKYGPIFTFKLGLHPALVLSSWEMTKECFTTNDLAVSSRPKLLAAKHLGYNYAMAAFSPHGPYWRELRTITTLELLSNHRLEQLSYMRVSEVETSLKELYRLWTLKKNESSHIINIYIYIYSATITLSLISKLKSIN